MLFPGIVGTGGGGGGLVSVWYFVVVSVCGKLVFIGGGGTIGGSPPELKPLGPVGRPDKAGGGSGLLLSAGRPEPRGGVPAPAGGSGGWMSFIDEFRSDGLTLCMPGSSIGRTVLVAEVRVKDEPDGSVMLEVGVPGTPPIGWRMPAPLSEMLDGWPIPGMGRPVRSGEPVGWLVRLRLGVVFQDPAVGVPVPDRPVVGVPVVGDGVGPGGTVLRPFQRWLLSCWQPHRAAPARHRPTRPIKGFLPIGIPLPRLEKMLGRAGRALPGPPASRPVRGCSPRLRPFLRSAQPPVKRGEVSGSLRKDQGQLQDPGRNFRKSG
jgi:hypothetical protein